jgi:hypothetical protein
MTNIITATNTWRRRFFLSVLGVVLVIAGVVVGIGLGPPRLSLDEVRSAVVSTLQSESPESILVTGSINVAVTTVSANTRYLLPGMVTLDLGTTEATARVPGTVNYGIDVGELDTTRIEIVDGVLYLTIPTIRVISVEPDLSALELQTRVGWARTHAGSGAAATRDAVSRITGALREQGERHVEEAIQPRINTAHAIMDVVTRALLSAGVEVKDVRVEVSPGIVVEKPRG